MRLELVVNYVSTISTITPKLFKYEDNLECSWLEYKGRQISKKSGMILDIDVMNASITYIICLLKPREKILISSI
jgi:hypothetical protein